MGTEVKANDKVMREYLMGLNASIPNYQRSYEWGSDQVGDFLEDLYSEAGRGVDPDSRYFFGPIITTNESSTGIKQIIDGQQRLTTTTIFLAVIRDILGTIKENDDADAIKHVIINELVGDGTKYHNYKIQQTGVIEEYFRESIQEYRASETVEPKKLKAGKQAKGLGKVNNVFRAYNQILESMNKYISAEETDAGKVFKIQTLFDVFTNQFFIVEISSPNRTDAFQIFQTINARGLDLSAADLIKSDFFGNSGEYTEDVARMWEEVVSNLGDLDLTDFIRYSWNSKFSFSTKRVLYKSVSKEMEKAEKSKEAIRDFMKILVKLSSPYAEMNGDQSATFLSDSKDGEKLKYLFEELSVFNFKTYAPTYLAMVNKGFSENEILTIMLEVSSLLIRNKIKSSGTNWLEKFLSEQAVEINDSDECHELLIEKIIENIKSKRISESITDDWTKRYLESYDFSRDLNLVRFILRTIENGYDGEKGLVPIDNKKIHIEHIMPQNPEEFDSWEVTQEIHEEYLWNLGNLTLWMGTKNSGAGNSAFQKKKSIYKDSDLQITREISKNNSWTPEEIRHRGEEIVMNFIKLR